MAEYLSNRINAIEESATIAMSQKARELKAAGKNVISLSLGEPDFKTPKHIQEAAKQAIDEEKYFSYPPVPGYPDLKEAIADKLNKENNIPAKPENIVVSNGAKHSIANVFFCLLNPGDEVVIFSPYWVSYADIVKLADSILHEPVKVEVTPVSSTAESINQSVYFVDKSNKKALLAHLLQDNTIENALIFTRTKHGANRVTKDLAKVGITADAIHGNKSQNARQNALKNFKSKQTRVLVATDIAARGIDVDELSHVINFDLPNVPETYVHRIGRTGRAGASGIAFSFCDREEKSYLASIHKLIDKRITVVDDHPFPLGAARTAEERAPQGGQRTSRSNQQGGNRQKNFNKRRRLGR